jgi:hypothetical protein
MKHYQADAELNLELPCTFGLVKSSNLGCSATPGLMSYSSNPRSLLIHRANQGTYHVHNKSFGYDLGCNSVPYFYPSMGYETQMQYCSTPYMRCSWDSNGGYYFPNSSSYYAEGEAAERKSFEGEIGKEMFAINLVDVLNKKDFRTTVMIKNIPNKYTQKMLLKKIDKKFKHVYDFFYLPIDLKNKCNVGYAFVNFISPLYILKFFEEFNGQRWEKFKSEKICQLAYARIQGHQALLIHFRSYDNVLQQSMKVRPFISQERKIDPSELANYEKKIRMTMTTEKINELTRLNQIIFGGK